MQIIPFQTNIYRRLANLLAHQSTFNLRIFPYYQTELVDPSVALSFLTALLEKEESRGVVAFTTMEWLRYLLGAYADSIFFGRHVWVPFGGMALKTSSDTAMLLLGLCSRRSALDRGPSPESLPGVSGHTRVAAGRLFALIRSGTGLCSHIRANMNVRN